eukprot:Plantae.Rhodophyta-Rhodochaete_pulchella.ctg14892.p1 GENE.Plantae.Rhodophyta-Rhodochaete_pulchella.ctg14892~~Plantae.Rhodophyta-Rhodochaete_pulchella.ctg14892.p1  ORF type:complete len:217 (+),score=31.59 Plantae.Rhodophyta-Rhodochaete_pulchella.ctg14892:1702-2352(+)
MRDDEHGGRNTKDLPQKRLNKSHPKKLRVDLNRPRQRAGGHQPGMFFMVKMERRMHVHPRFFNSRLKQTLQQRLCMEVEGTAAGTYGFVVSVVGLDKAQPFPPGHLDEVTGNAIFALKYDALVFRPFKGQVLDAVVTRVMQLGLYAEAGPMTIFVSKYQLPEDFAFDDATECWRSADQLLKIESSTSVRLRITGLKIEVQGFFATGTMADDFLGVV